MHARDNENPGFSDFSHRCFRRSLLTSFVMLPDNAIVYVCHFLFDSDSHVFFFYPYKILITLACLYFGHRA